MEAWEACFQEIISHEEDDDVIEPYVVELMITEYDGATELSLIHNLCDLAKSHELLRARCLALEQRIDDERKRSGS